VADQVGGQVAAVAIGVRRTGGYAARVERLRAEGETMPVFACEERPGEYCGTSQAQSNPFHLNSDGLPGHSVASWVRAGPLTRNTVHSSMATAPSER